MHLIRTSREGADPRGGPFAMHLIRVAGGAGTERLGSLSRTESVRRLATLGGQFPSLFTTNWV